jgi:hypothetical protein
MVIKNLSSKYGTGQFKLKKIWTYQKFSTIQTFQTILSSLMKLPELKMTPIMKQWDFLIGLVENMDI